MIVALQKYPFTNSFFLNTESLNQNSRKTAAVIEITGSHEECIYAQLLHLKAGGYYTLLICSANLEKKVFDFDKADEILYFDVREEVRKSHLQLLKIRALLIARNVEIVCINSAHGKLIQNLLLLPYPKSIRFFGVLHGINKLRKSITQKLISRRIRHYFVLNDYLIENLHKVPHGALKFESYYPIFFPHFEERLPLQKPAGQLWITIPGQVEYARRDYRTLVAAFAKLRVKPDLKFIFLGSWDHPEGNGPALQQLIEELALTEYFVFTGYQANPEFHAMLKASDIIMPLIHPGNEGFEKYFSHQITGAYNLAFAHHKPLLMLQDFDRYSDFKENAIFYTPENLSQVFTDLAVRIADAKPQLYKNPKWTEGYQRATYLRFIQH